VRESAIVGKVVLVLADIFRAGLDIYRCILDKENGKTHNEVGIVLYCRQRQ